MRRKYDPDIFKDSTMTFGEHLEELRKCLWRAILGLGIGFIIGLAIGDRVVEFIQYPLQLALGQYYKDRSIERAKDHLEEVKHENQPLPWTPEQVAEMVNEKELLPEVMYVAPDEVLRELSRNEAYRGKLPPVKPSPAEGAEGAEGEAAPLPDLIPMFVWHPVQNDDRLRVKSLSAQEGFMIYMKASLLVGVVLASPWIFYQIWSFVAAGLYPHEKKYVNIFLPFSVGLFLAGAAMAFFLVFPPLLKFLFWFNRSLGIEPDPRISEWLGFVLMMPLGFGIAFQMPLVMLFLERIGIFDVAAYLAKWRIAILIMAVAAAILTPSPDPYSMLLMLTPLIGLYFGGILLCKYLPRRESEFDTWDD